MESAYLAFMVQYGVPGILLLVGGLLCAGILGVRAVIRQKDNPYEMYFGCLAIAALLWVGLFGVTSVAFDSHTLLPVALILGSMGGRLPGSTGRVTTT